MRIFRRPNTCEAWTVLYLPRSADETAQPESYVCLAFGYEAAKEQCQEAFPGCDIVWVMEGSSPSLARLEYLDTCAAEAA